MAQGLLTYTAPVFAAPDTDVSEQALAVPADSAVLVSSVEALGPPTDVWDRIRRGFGMPTYQSPLVDKWVTYYATKNPEYLNRMFNRSGRYVYHIIEEVEARGMPTELALLPFVESAFQPEALSKAKASGLWQFMPATGRNYDLAQNIWRDERLDPVSSTRAALDYFEYLNGLFHDWQLALAAYNWGEGSVQRAVRRQKAQGRPTDYAHLRMPKETANYVPKLEAIKRIVADPAKYGITLPEVGNEPYFVTITKPRDIDTKTAAELADMDLADFKALNPSFKLPVIIAAHNNLMQLPADKVDDFIDNLASWMDSGQPLSRWTTYKLKKGETLSQIAQRTGMSEVTLRKINGIPKGRRVLANSTLLVRANADQQEDITASAADARLRLSPSTTWRRVTYRVRRGDTISGIARRWHITKKSIVKSNRLRSSLLRVGQRLILTVPNVERAPIRYTPQTTTKNIIHSVKRGQTLSGIASRYGVSVATIKKTNRLRTNRLKVGQRLRIPKAGAPVSVPKSYTVRRGDTISGIARRFGVSTVRLKRANHMSDSRIRVGQELEIPSGTGVRTAPAQPAGNDSPVGTYTVRSGDSLYNIARQMGVTVSKLKAVNGLRSNRLRIGQKLMIPATAKPKAGAVKKTAANKTYRVRSGDSLYTIAKRHGTSIKTLKRVNHLRRNTLKVGQRLRLP